MKSSSLENTSKTKPELVETVGSKSVTSVSQPVTTVASVSKPDMGVLASQMCQLNLAGTGLGAAVTPSLTGILPVTMNQQPRAAPPSDQPDLLAQLGSSNSSQSQNTAQQGQLNHIFNQYQMLLNQAALQTQIMSTMNMQLAGQNMASLAGMPSLSGVTMLPPDGTSSMEPPNVHNLMGVNPLLPHGVMGNQGDGGLAMFGRGLPNLTAPYAGGSITTNLGIGRGSSRTSGAPPPTTGPEHKPR